MIFTQFRISSVPGLFISEDRSHDMVVATAQFLEKVVKECFTRAHEWRCSLWTAISVSFYFLFCVRLCAVEAKRISS